jgi:hypothetical protein
MAAAIPPIKTTPNHNLEPLYFCSHQVTSDENFDWASVHGAVASFVKLFRRRDDDDDVPKSCLVQLEDILLFPAKILISKTFFT